MFLYKTHTNSLQTFGPASQLQFCSLCEFPRVAHIVAGVRGSCDRMDIVWPTN